MSIGEDVHISIRSIRKRMVESLLLAIGIALGIGATGAGIALVSNSMRETDKVLNSPEYREIVVSLREDNADMDIPAVPVEVKTDVILTTADLAAAREAPDVQYAYISNPARFRLGEEPMGPPPGGGEGGPSSEAGGAQPAQFEELSGYRVSPEFFAAWDIQAEQGSLFTADDMASDKPLIVLGSELAASMYADKNAVGEKLRMNGNLYTISGVLEPTGSSFDRLVFTPAFMPNLRGTNTGMLRMADWNTSLRFSVKDPEKLDAAKNQLASYFERNFGQGAVVISVPREEAELAKTRSVRLVTVVMFLSIAGLLIAGVNVSNIMMGRAMRRQRSIGVLKALGASRTDIFRLFFSEALLLCVAGAVIGTGLSLLLSPLMEKTMGFGGVNALILALGILIAWIFTLAMTVLPALQAARVPAAEAIRNE